MWGVLTTLEQDFWLKRAGLSEVLPRIFTLLESRYLPFSVAAKIYLLIDGGVLKYSGYLHSCPMQLANRTEEMERRGDLGSGSTEALTQDNRLTQEDPSQKTGKHKREDNLLPKKFKARFACQECRERKIRCDGAHPGQNISNL